MEKRKAICVLSVFVYLYCRRLSCLVSKCLHCPVKGFLKFLSIIIKCKCLPAQFPAPCIERSDIKYLTADMTSTVRDSNVTDDSAPAVC